MLIARTQIFFVFSFQVSSKNALFDVYPWDDIVSFAAEDSSQAFLFARHVILTHKHLVFRAQTFHTVLF